MTTQVAASCVLLVVSALLARALYHAYNSDLGFDYTHVITIDSRLYAHGYTPDKAANYTQEFESRLQEIPGVSSAALVRNPPFGNRASFENAHDEIKVNIHFNRISPEFFQTLAIALLRGRDFTPADRDVAIVSESAARNLWPGKDPLQQAFTYSDRYGRRRLPVIGLVANARLTALRNGDDAIVYMPLGDDERNAAVMLVRTSQPPENLVATVASVARSVNPGLSPDVQMLGTTLQDRMGDSAKFTAVVGGMGAMALLLATVGLFGVVAYSVAQRTREIGIRMALGATSTGIVRNMLSNLTLPLSVAVITGLGLAATLSTVMRKYLYGLSNWDPLSYALAVVLLAAVAGLATMIPARRSLKVDPMVALRCE